MGESCNTQDQIGQERKENPKSKGLLVESKEELDESERELGRRVSDRLSESENGLGESGLKRETLNPGLCALFKCLILFLGVPLQLLSSRLPNPSHHIRFEQRSSLGVVI